MGSSLTELLFLVKKTNFVVGEYYPRFLEFQKRSLSGI
jgi:hypothetical protein